MLIYILLPDLNCFFSSLFSPLVFSLKVEIAKLICLSLLLPWPFVFLFFLFLFNVHSLSGTKCKLWRIFHQMKCFILWCKCQGVGGGIGGGWLCVFICVRVCSLCSLTNNTFTSICAGDSDGWWESVLPRQGRRGQEGWSRPVWFLAKSHQRCTGFWSQEHVRSVKWECVTVGFVVLFFSLYVFCLFVCFLVLFFIF